ncbi:MAG: lipid kinase [Proteobacteria bacterium]|nr:MAG: lipid kinase [Pseudomonadota bacterium]
MSLQVLPPMTYKKALLLINSKSRQGEKLGPEILKASRSLGLEVIHLPTDPCDFAKRIEEYQDRVDLVMVAGGDGSQNASLPGLLKTKLPLLTIPLGTSNNLARNLAISLDPFEAMKLVQTGSVKTIDLGSVNDQPFFAVAGMGISIHVNQTVPSKLKRKIGKLAYVATAIKVFAKYRPFHAVIERSGEKPSVVRTLQISVCNGRHFGSGLMVDGKATVSDGVLHLFSVEVKKWHNLLSAIYAVHTGKHGKTGPTLILEGKDFTITTRTKHRIDVDGEISTQTPAHFKVLPQSLKIFVPPQTDQVVP